MQAGACVQDQKERQVEEGLHVGLPEDMGKGRRKRRMAKVSEKCCFLTNSGCGVTTYAQCPERCSFFKTYEQHKEGEKRAEQILREKGLVKVETVDEKGVHHISVKSARSIR